MPEVPRAAIADYGMGNLFSVKHACETVGLDAEVTAEPADLDTADAVILPGVGAFGDAMVTLRERGLAEAVVRCAQDGRPLLGVCLGLQLLMERSHEFGEHEGLGIVPGEVVRLEALLDARPLKVPEVCWNQVWEERPGAWEGTALSALPDGAWQYFVHSYVARPSDPDMVLATTRYGDAEFCSVAGWGNVLACQFHPERSGRVGLRVYREFARLAGVGRVREERLV